MIMFILILVLAGVILIGLYIHDPKFYWKVVQRYLWHELKPQIENINIIYERTSRNGKKIGILEKGSVKKQLFENEKSYNDYLDFCKSKELALPADYQQILNEIDSSTEILDPKRALDKKLEQANKKYDETYENVNAAGNELLEERRRNIKLIDAAEQLVNSIARHPKSFDDHIDETIIQRQKFDDTQEYAKKAEIDLKKYAGGAAAGVAAGAGVASLAPTAAMWVATTFGTASTGTAISALSGAAAQSAALAWLGGGTLAAGGGGVVAGQAFLALAGPIGWGIAGASILASVILFVTKKFNAQEKEKEEIVQITKCTEALEELQKKIEVIYSETCSLSERLDKQFKLCSEFRGKDYSSLLDEDQQYLGVFVNNVLSLSSLLNKTISE